MENNLHQATQNISEEEKQVQAQQALELEQLEDREFQGTYRNDQASI